MVEMGDEQAMIKEDRTARLTKVLYSPVPAISVPFLRRIRNCSGLSWARHSASLFWMLCKRGRHRRRQSFGCL